MASPDEKPTPPQELEDMDNNSIVDPNNEVSVDNHAAGKILSINDADLPKGYFLTPYFIGSMFAIGMSLMCGVAGFAFVAPILSFVNADIGPSPDLTWVALTYTLTGAIGLMIVGRLTGMYSGVFPRTCHFKGKIR
jgi:hypothetical protein